MTGRSRRVVAIGIAIASMSSPQRVAAQDTGFSQGRRIDARTGDAIYRTICQGCHMPDGRGAIGAGAYPALANNPRAANATYVAITVLDGRRNMPSFADVLDDVQIAEVVREVRSRFADASTAGGGDTVDAAGVAALRTTR